MKVSLRESTLGSEVKLLDVEGRIDAFNHTILQEELQTLLRIGSNKVVCNLSKVEYIGPAGLRTFLSAVNQARQSGGDILFSSLPPYIQRKFEFAGFNDICSFHSTDEDAIHVFDDVDLLAKTIWKPSLQQGQKPEQKGTEKLSGHKPQERAVSQEITEVLPLDGDDDEPEKPADTDVLDAKMAEAATQELSWNGVSPAEENTDENTRVISSEKMKSIAGKIDQMDKKEPEEGKPAPEDAKASPEEQKCEKTFTFPVNYYIYQKLREGYLGKLYFAKEGSSHGFLRPVALKYIKNQFAHNRSVMKLLSQEIEQVFSIHHQHIAQIQKIVTLENYSFIVMEYVKGFSLAYMMQKLRRSNHGFPPSVASLVAYCLFAAMDYANRRTDEKGEQADVVHGEINPGNIMVSENSDVKLLGLGLSKVKVMLQFQQDPNCIKDIAYMAPEVVSTGIPSKSGDIFSIGVVFYEMLTGDLPYTEDQIRHQNLGFPPRPSHSNERVGDILDNIVIRLLMQDPARRFQDFRDAAIQIEEMLLNKGFCLTRVAMEKFLENNRFF